MSKRNIGMHRYVIAISLGLCCVFMAYSSSAKSDPLPVSLKHVIDGDTFRGFIDGKGKDLPIRLRNVDTPELRGKCRKEIDMAQSAKLYLKQLLESGKIELSNIGKDKYGRVLATVLVNNQNVSELIIKNGYGRRWSGRRESWCN